MDNDAAVTAPASVKEVVKYPEASTENNEVDEGGLFTDNAIIDFVFE